MKRLFLISIAICQSSLHVFADPSVIKLWPNASPGPAAVTTGTEQDMTKPDERIVAERRVIRLGNVSEPEIHVRLPDAERANGTAVIVCPGGGFNILAWDLEGLEVAEWLNSIGVAAIVLKYRVPTRTHNWPGMVEGPTIDAQRALNITRSNGSAWKIDVNRVGMLGFSAGAATVARTVAKNGNLNYEPIDDADRSSRLPNFALLIYPGAIVDEQGELRSEYEWPSNGPPTFFVHAADDPVKCDNSVRLFSSIRATTPAELHVFSVGGHGYGLRQTSDPVTSWPKLAETWMTRNGWLEIQPR